MFFVFLCFALICVLFLGRAVIKKAIQYKLNTTIPRTVTILLSILCVIGMVFSTIKVIDAGHVGVVDVFGSVEDKELPPGINFFVNPFAKVTMYSTQTHEHKEAMNVLTQEGLTIGLEMSAMYRLHPDSASSVYKTVKGGDYEGVILIPQFRSAGREVTATYKASALYSVERTALGVSVEEDLRSKVTRYGVIIESTPLRNVALPAQLTKAIEEKQTADQESQRMEFVLTKEKQEADRKRIEAQGISDFQNIVAQGISEPLLRWKGIEATEKLAQSGNSKIVIIGSGKDGLPVILDTK